MKFDVLNRFSNSTACGNTFLRRSTFGCMEHDTQPGPLFRWGSRPNNLGGLIGRTLDFSQFCHAGLTRTYTRTQMSKLYHILSKVTGYLKNRWMESGVSHGAEMFWLDNPTMYWQNIRKIQDEAGSAVNNAYPLKRLYKSCDHCHVGLSVRGSKMHSSFITRANASSVFMCRQSQWPTCMWEINYEKVQLNCTCTRQSQRRTLCQVSIDCYQNVNWFANGIRVHMIHFFAGGTLRGNDR